MEVDKKTLSKWKLKKKQGDQKEIADINRMPENRISRAFLGRSSQETIDAINKYYNLKP